eukprot:TRINITY_DN4129_c0_g1_i1.p2 TRINITY_DN4129_c0_g1~~TRINITY_DN4129_c0_g1_i1.p2  ORF type:complete len:204 (+),score=28.06 TRINITY_DN4129_c0_g1_i1:68-613(+)
MGCTQGKTSGRHGRKEQKDTVRKGHHKAHTHRHYETKHQSVPNPPSQGGEGMMGTATRKVNELFATEAHPASPVLRGPRPNNPPPPLSGCGSGDMPLPFVMQPKARPAKAPPRSGSATPPPALPKRNSAKKNSPGTARKRSSSLSRKHAAINPRSLIPPSEIHRQVQQASKACSEQHGPYM